MRRERFVSVRTTKTRLTIFRAFLVFTVLWLLLFCVGIRFNTTGSIPIGVYIQTSKPIEKGTYVDFCPPDTAIFQEAKQRGYIDAGLCHGNLGGMMKQVAAVAGDTVSIEQAGVFVNGKILPFSKPFATDAKNRPLPTFSENNHVLKENEVLLMTDRDVLSFDARYFGLIDKKQLKSTIRPIFVW